MYVNWSRSKTLILLKSACFRFDDKSRNDAAVTSTIRTVEPVHPSIRAVGRQGCVGHKKSSQKFLTAFSRGLTRPVRRRIQVIALRQSQRVPEVSCVLFPGRWPGRRSPFASLYTGRVCLSGTPSRGPSHSRRFGHVL